MKLLIFAFSLVIYYSIHSILAIDQIKKKIISLGLADRYYRIFYNIIAVLLLIPLAAAYIYCPTTMLLNTYWPLQMIGGVVLLIGVLLLYMSIQQYDTREFSGLAQFEGDASAGNHLVKSGLNRHVRHPLYFASLILFWGAFIVWPSASHLILATLGSIYIVIGSKLEEQKLMRLFGEEYKQYQRDVPMLIPRIADKKTLMN